MQGELAFGGESPVRSPRPGPIFFCVLLETAQSLCVSEFAERVIQENHLKATRIKQEHLHISLRGIGEYSNAPTRLIDEALRVGESVSMRPFEVTLHAMMSFRPDASGRWPLVLHARGQGLLELQAMLRPAAGRNGRKTTSRS